MESSSDPPPPVDTADAANKEDDNDKKPAAKPSANEAAAAAADEEEEGSSSDVELDGIDLADDPEAIVEEDDDDDNDEMPDAAAAGAPPAAAAAGTASVDPDETIAAAAAADAQDLEEARKERMELMAAEKEKLAAIAQQGGAGDAKTSLEYLLQQSDVFAHFLAGSVAATSGKGSKKGSGNGHRGRMSEAEEDAQLLKSAASRVKIVRLDKQPSNLHADCKMRFYQLEGLNWMIKLHDHGINGILADEMGLGKTLQTISLLAYLREGRGVRGPHLIIVPKSVVGNWMKEFKKWCPCIKTIRMGGKREERDKIIKEGYLQPDKETGRFRFDALVTSYEGVLKEKNKFSKVPWHYLIIDEAHRIKNEKSSLSLAVREMDPKFRLLITGTPLQNNLRELWALLNFLLPEVFGDAEQFDEWFSLSGESGKENVIRKLHTVLRPFMLRRVKKDVAKDLPPKKETKLYVGLTDLQREWYVNCLQKDAHELNKLGGPDKSRLMNVLMQLRKVTNHPYLFNKVEPGPPYIDGPHLWEASGKMLLLHKLLPKLKAKESRVLIFCQMTRVLDILEDYMRYVGHEYCRIDGSTDGTLRDDQMEEFNKPGSTKFCFLLSTRAGGLGINLATADIVILYDSDFNPQVDLQAMDRSHRLGQTKPVQVFRFITEGTVEEKIVERADRKLFLDAAVIQQGRLAEQNSSLDKGDLMKMVKFGADQILSGSGGTYTDEDIDALIARGEERTSEMQAKLQTDAQHNLANFSLMADDEINTFSFDGKNYRETDKNSGGLLINLPQRQRKRYYDLGAEKGAGGNKAPAETNTKKKQRRGPALHDFQLFDMERLNAIIEKERRLVSKKEEHIKKIKFARNQAQNAPSLGSGVAVGHSREELVQQAERMTSELDAGFSLTKEEEREKEKLLAEGFPDWSRKDFKSFCSALERHGRYDFVGISRDVMNETGKGLSEVQRYFVAFFTNYQRIGEWQKILDRIEKGEKKILRLRQIRDAIQEKVERHLEDTFSQHYSDNDNKTIPSIAEMINYSWPRMKINYFSSGAMRGKGYTEEEDAFLVCQMYRHGFGSAERIRMEIRRAWQFRFDWFFKSRSAQEIQKRCDMLVKLVERENEEVRKTEAEERAKQTSAAATVSDAAAPPVTVGMAAPAVTNTTK